MSWTAVALPVLAGVAVVFLPGLAIAVAARLRGVAALGVAGPLGYLIVGLTGVVAAAVHVRFGWAPLAVVAAALVVLVVALRVAARALGRPLPAWDTWRPGAWLPALGGVVVASAVVTGIAYAAVATPSAISQTYDAVFHLNAAAFVVQSGDASSLHLYRLTHPGKDLAFYPAVWHSITALIVELSGTAVPTAANATWIATAGPVFASGSALSAAVLFGRTGLRRDVAPALQRPLVAAAGALLASCFVAFPYMLLDFGTLYPNGLAYTMLPAGIALIAAVLPWPATAAWSPEAPLPRLRTALLLLAWFGGAAFTHPRSVVALVVLAAPLALAWFAARMGALASRGERGRRAARRGWVLLALGVVLVGVAGAVFVYHYYDVATRPISDHLNGGPALARETLPQALLQGLLATSLVAPTQAALPPSVLLAAIAFAGLIAALLRPGLRWAVVTYLLVVLLYGLAAGSDSDLAKVATGLWDKDKFRILAMLPMIGVPLTAWVVVAGTTEVVAHIRSRRARRQDARPATVVVAVAAVALVVGAVTWTGPALTGMSTAIGAVFALPATAKDGRLLDAQTVALLSSVDRFVPEGQVIAGNPWNGSALAWALGDRRTLFPHLGGYWGTDGNTVKKHLAQWADDPAVCPAVRELDVHWVITDTGRLSGDKSAAKAFRSVDRVVKTDGVQLVASSGSAKLWRLTACWPGGPEGA